MNSRIYCFCVIFTLFLFPVRVFLIDIISPKPSWRCQSFDLENLYVNNENYLAVFNMVNCTTDCVNIMALRGLLKRMRNIKEKNIDFILLTDAINGSKKFQDIKSKTGSQIELVTLNETGTNFELFNSGNIFIFDNCQQLFLKFTSEIFNLNEIKMTNKSMIQVIKAAILATYFDSICPPCSHSNDDLYDKDFYNQDEDYLDQEENKTVIEMLPYPNGLVDVQNESTQEDNTYNIPLRIIYPIEHVHASNKNRSIYEKYNYIILRSNDSTFHSHVQSDKVEYLKIYTAAKVETNETSSFQNLTNTLKVNNNNENDIKNKQFVDNEGLKYRHVLPFGVTNALSLEEVKYEEISPIYEYEVIPPKFTEPDYNDTSLYKSLLPWMDFQLNILEEE